MSDFENGFADGYDWAKVVVNAYGEDSEITALQLEIIEIAIEYGNGHADFRKLILDAWRKDVAD